MYGYDDYYVLVVVYGVYDDYVYDVYDDYGYDEYYYGLVLG